MVYILYRNSLYSWLSLNSLFRQGDAEFSEIHLLLLLNAEIKGVYQHTWPMLYI